MNRSIKQLSLFLVLLFSAFSQTAFAHFHYELSVNSAFQANHNNQLESMKISWTYDDEVSGLMLKDQPDIKKLEKKLIKDLEKLAYFTSLKLNGKAIKTKKVTTFNLKEIKHDDYSNLKFTFTLPLETPIQLNGKNSIVINHEDATLSAIIYYENPQSFVFDKALNANCTLDIVEKTDFEEGESPQDVTVVCES